MSLAEVGDVVALARGRYAQAGVDRALAAAHSRSAVVSHASAALRHGWQVRLPPEPAEVAAVLEAAVVEREQRGCRCGCAA